MKKSLITIILILLFIAICSSFNQNSRNSEKAFQGGVNLNTWNFAQDGVVKLDGLWELI